MKNLKMHIFLVRLCLEFSKHFCEGACKPVQTNGARGCLRYDRSGAVTGQAKAARSAESRPSHPPRRRGAVPCRAGLRYPCCGPAEPGLGWLALAGRNGRAEIRSIFQHCRGAGTGRADSFRVPVRQTFGGSGPRGRGAQAARPARRASLGSRGPPGRRGVAVVTSPAAPALRF